MCIGQSRAVLRTPAVIMNVQYPATPPLTPAAVKNTETTPGGNPCFVCMYVLYVCTYTYLSPQWLL